MNGKITDKPRKPCELADYYGVSLGTFNGWISRVIELSDIRRKRKGCYYSILEVKKIVEHFGES